jgi:hypothetical protein
MKKNVLDKDCSEYLVSRVQKLKPETAPFWGTMTTTEMLLHCNRVNEQLLTAEPLRKGTRIKQYIARCMVLYVIPKFPKNARTPKRNVTKGQVNNESFAEQLEQFIQLIRRFPLRDKPIELPHPYFGDLSTQQWGLANYKHMDHHLRQFGV